MLISVLLVALPQVSFGKLVIAVIQLAYAILLIVVKPYFLQVQNVLLIISQFIGLGFTFWTIVSDYVYLNDKIQNFIMMGYEGLLILVGILAIVRLVLHFKENEKAFKMMHQEEDRLKGKDLFSKT